MLYSAHGDNSALGDQLSLRLSVISRWSVHLTEVNSAYGGQPNLEWSTQLTIVNSAYGVHFSLRWPPQLTEPTSAYDGHFNLRFSLQLTVPTSSYDAHFSLWCPLQLMENILRLNRYPRSKEEAQAGAGAMKKISWSAKSVTQLRLFVHLWSLGVLTAAGCGIGSVHEVVRSNLLVEPSEVEEGEISVSGALFIVFVQEQRAIAAQGMDTLIALMNHPALVSASNTFTSLPERKISVGGSYSSGVSRSCKWVYLFQREFATVEPALVDVGFLSLFLASQLVGTDEATTCVGVVIRNKKGGMISVAHMDFPEVVDIGLCQMLSLLSDHGSDSLLDVHLVGGFDDFSSQVWSEKFEIRTLHVLAHDTRWDPGGIAYPLFHGFVVETNSGSIVPASFERKSRCPDEIVRRIRVTACFEDPNWTGKLLETYDTETDCFVIAPCVWTIWQSRLALTHQYLSDSEILLTCSSSPSAEGPDFVDSIKRKWDYLIRHPDWRETFPSKQARVFQRNAEGSWVKL
ncbi:protein N-terminal asparagine amidohydrolase-like [Dorcoceras hygrometricum]|uniref:Protein N-terminal asparagine amidohydrolase-like n=1 Tax=Dorcoceras hygrometricum TaxID=472368 RepID=A0A2Z7D9G2_9LAMI|nr:protein N-terminal asparagine amidohydrolase-like [Dorcoceras hygrometricum]